MNSEEVGESTGTEKRSRSHLEEFGGEKSDQRNTTINGWSLISAAGRRTAEPAHRAPAK